MLTTENLEPSTADIDTVMIIPLGAPVPTEFKGEAPPEGDLYQRLAPLALPRVAQPTLAALSGTELVALERVWRHLVKIPRPVFLTDLPGAIYDVTFVAAARMIGLHSISWPDYSDRVAARRTETQRVKDRSPWAAGEDLVSPTTDAPATSVVKRRTFGTPSTTSAAGDRLPFPNTDLDGDSDL